MGGGAMKARICVQFISQQNWDFGEEGKGLGFFCFFKSKQTQNFTSRNLEHKSYPQEEETVS